MKAIFINAKDQKIERIDLGNDNRAMYNKIAFGCTLVELVSVEANNDGLFCDDEGVFEGHSSEGEHHFGFMWCTSKIYGTFQTYFLICGNALMIGCDENGKSIDFKTPLKEVEKRIMFLSSDTVKTYKSNF